jgi:competence protein ComEC
MLYSGAYKILFTGDIEAPVESILVAKYGSALNADVLKVSHHGSISSSCKLFLETVSPKFAIISVGEA